jgi:transposase
MWAELASNHLNRSGLVGGPKASMIVLAEGSSHAMPAPRKYPDELRERAVRMVFEVREQTGQAPGAIARVAQQLGVHREALRSWVRQAEIDGGQRPGTSTEDAQRIAELEREVRELRRANDILKSAAAFFARELDPRPPR